jgi:hypothetical protein
MVAREPLQKNRCLLQERRIDIHVSKPSPRSREPYIRVGTRPTGERRSELRDQLQRLQDLYVLGDLTKPQYVMRRQALEEEVQRLGPPTEPAIDRARALLDFPRFWELETRPPERRKLLRSGFGQIWAQDGRIVAVQPHDDFCPTSKPPTKSRTPPRRRWCR